MAQDLCSGNTKITKWPTVGSGQSKYGTRVVFREQEEHEVAYILLRAFKMAWKWCSGNTKSTEWPT
eukprot:6957563-Pyramimonas_sp.AAC.1